MEAFKIITNTTADLPMDYIEENRLGLIYFNYIMDEVSYGKIKSSDSKRAQFPPGGNCALLLIPGGCHKAAPWRTHFKGNG